MRVTLASRITDLTCVTNREAALHAPCFAPFTFATALLAASLPNSCSLPPKFWLDLASFTHLQLLNICLHMCKQQPTETAMHRLCGVQTSVVWPRACHVAAVLLSLKCHCQQGTTCSLPPREQA
mmetsp:Transcript_2181/g.4055  ORF Transcript_2181/g.4055 Transcript_2181/m.4055 type:complete len:124 (+) Transcript_2181:1772-2143(+)